LFDEDVHWVNKYVHVAAIKAPKQLTKYATWYWRTCATWSWKCVTWWKRRCVTWWWWQ